MCAPRIRTIHIERILGGLTRQNKSENAKTNLLWSPSTTADINFFRFPTRVARGIFGTRRVPRFSHPFYILRMVVCIPGGAAHMRSINYADSATKTARERERESWLFPMWRLFRFLPLSSTSSQNCSFLTSRAEGRSFLYVSLSSYPRGR